MRDELITECGRCGHRERVELLPTFGTACVACGGYGSLVPREAVVVESPVPPAEPYLWTPYLAPRVELS